MHLVHEHEPEHVHLAQVAHLFGRDKELHGLVEIGVGRLLDPLHERLRRLLVRRDDLRHGRRGLGHLAELDVAVQRLLARILLGHEYPGELLGGFALAATPPNGRRLRSLPSPSVCDLLTAVIYTIGHSTLPLDEFLVLLRVHGVDHVVDVRRYPGSRRYPQFGREALAAALANAGVGYEHAPDLGGRRVARADSVNTAWRSASFRGYADYMETHPFQTALA